MRVSWLEQNQVSEAKVHVRMTFGASHNLGSSHNFDVSFVFSDPTHSSGTAVQFDNDDYFVTFGPSPIDSVGYPY